MIASKNNKGFTLAEALIAMLLVAVMAAGIITALMATKRAITAPSNREDMVMAIGKAAALLQQEGQDICDGEDGEISAAQKLINTDACILSDKATHNNCHNIDCLKPKSCQGADDYFVYSVSDYEPPADVAAAAQNQKVVTFRIECEGQTI